MRHLIASRYEIHDLLGQGGMGEVFRGLDTHTGEVVAIKRLKPEIVADDPDLVRRFDREGEALRKLNHPNIVKMLAAIAEDGRHYLVMEYVGGGSLESLMDDQTQMPINRVLDIALDLADALTRAHRLKIVHRDIKPANVLMAADGTPRLTDFGVAYMEEVTRVTQSGVMIGTYAYLSPESCNGETVDERSDIWSFGVMLYEMLAGRRPFDGESPAATLTAILTRPTPDLRALRPDAPPALVSLILKMLEKDRAQRIPSVRLVGAELEALLRGGETPRIASSDAPAEAPKSRFSTPTPSGSHVQVMTTADGTRFVAVPRKFAFVPVLVILSLVALVTVLFLVLNSPVGTNTASALPTVVPVAPGEYMVLVGQIEHLSGEERDVTRFVVDNLRQALEVEVPFSNVRIRQYPQIITSAEQARAAAEQTGAPVIIWGNYNADGVQVEVQIGSTAAFPDNVFTREMLERTVNVRVRLTDERQQSLAPTIIGLLFALQAANGDMYQAMLEAAIFEELEPSTAEIVGNSVAAHLHRSIQTTLTDLPTSTAEMDEAIALDSGNPLLYTFRSIGYVRQGDLSAALREAETSQRLAPQDWPIPLYTLAAGGGITNVEEITQRYAGITTLRPQDWFAWTLSGTGSYLLGELDAARANLERAIELEPESNIPYLFAVPVTLRQGDIATAVSYSQTMVRDFPDPTLGGRVLGAAMGEQIGGTMAQYLSITGNLALGQYDSVLTQGNTYLSTMSPTNPLFQAMALISGTDSEVLTEIMSRFASDVYLMYGLAQCNLRDFPTAEAAYTNGLNADPNYTLLYLMRADVRLKQGNDAGAEEDLIAVEQSALAEPLAPYGAALRAGDLDCTNLLSLSNPVLAAES